MKIFSLIPLICAAATLTAVLPDVTIRTRSFSVGRQGAIETVTVQWSGARQRDETRTEFSGGQLISAVTQILDCDRRRVLVLNDMAKVFGLEPVPARAAIPAASLRNRPVEDTRPVVETRTIDAVDTGERRAVGPLSARHVITTTTVERPGAAARVENVRDGWYVDMPSRSCDGSSAEARAMLIASRGAGRADVRWRGTAKTGFPVEERDRTTDGDFKLERRTELLDVSADAISAKAFDVPDGYRPAVPLPGGGHDLTRPDTLGNRVSVWWNAAASWVGSFWR